MGSTFVDSEFGDTVESQLTLGTASLLGIFFGLVMVCGMFFGFGYSIGRRNSSSSIASVVPPAHTSPAPVMAQPALAPSAPSTPFVSVQDASKAAPPASAPPTALTPPAPELAPAPKLAVPAPLLARAPDAEHPAPVRSHAAEATVNPYPVTAPVSAQPYVEAKVRIPKPSAIQPTTDLPNTRLPLQHTVASPQFTSRNLPSPYFVWTPPFDVHYKKGFNRGSNRAVAHLSQGVSEGSMSGVSRPPATYTTVARTSYLPHMAASSPAMTVQVAALSRQDDAQVLVSALREHGFAPSIASGTEDTLYHVQVGPFTRDVAFATRQRLIAKGYNATLR